MRKISQATVLCLAALEFVLTLGWTVDAICLPKLATSAAIAARAVIWILMPHVGRDIFGPAGRPLMSAKITFILMSAFAAAFARMAASAAGVLNDPALTPPIQWAPVASWATPGAVLIAPALTRYRGGTAIAAIP